MNVSIKTNLNFFLAAWQGSRKSVKDDVLQSKGIEVPRDDFVEDMEDDLKNSISKDCGCSWPGVMWEKKLFSLNKLNKLIGTNGLKTKEVDLGLLCGRKF